ncbi:hypothetical protein I3J09_01150 [Streptomyces clavuligerus]|uniref:Uncharacterized protein n=1 Tax=Streptomyces clavuligerus TaxID=1901 RepID=E2Q0J4_STRCL|nr:hypothetical protein [Streptomyces clavuligerus]ANW16937.1 hypothetical protein BB341_01185 [Streptomyces clavuligerus]EFG10537.1 Hypothetical protein SCLAV_5470 [Streptomyces clavuligerus]MBY6301285.1 hypothetical protein [Streptomyces clavuligerus]QCS04338.1 hypothetical protein CRV15_01260 [Streptomyces clavuligerus]QPJ96275.1 hypothetical protein GE265_26610 [Streptomyces clavuligerus]
MSDAVIQENQENQDVRNADLPNAGVPGGDLPGEGAPGGGVVAAAPEQPQDSFSLTLSLAAAPRAVDMTVIATGFNVPTGVYRRQEALWVAEYGNGGNLYRVDEATGSRTRLAQNLGGVEYLDRGVFLDSGKDALFTAVYTSGTLYEVTAETGSAYRVPAASLGAAQGSIIIARSTYAVVQEDGGGVLWKVTREGAATRIAGGLGRPQDVSCVSYGTDELYVTDEDNSGRLLRVSVSSGAVTTVADGLGSTGGLCCTPGNEAFVVEKTASGGIWRIDLATGRRAKVVSGIGNLHDIHVSGHDVYVTDTDNGGRVLRLNRLALPEPDAIVLVGGDGQRQHTGGEFGALSVQVTRGGEAAAGRRVTFEIVDTDGTGTDFAGGSPAVLTSDAYGKATTGPALVAGTRPGMVRVRATAGGSSVTFLLTVREASLPTDVTVGQGHPAAARPGTQWIYPALRLRNVDRHPLGTEPLVITAPPGLRFLEDSVAFTRQADEPAEHLATGERGTDLRTLTLWDVPFDTAPGAWVLIYPAMEIDPDAEPGVLPVEFAIGGPVIVRGQVGVTVTG